MLLSINLLSTDLYTFQGELPAAPTLSGRPADGFAEMLGHSVMSAVLQPQGGSGSALSSPGGQSLPDDGNALPLDDLPQQDWAIQFALEIPLATTTAPLAAPMLSPLAVSVPAATAPDSDGADSTTPLPGSPDSARQLLLRNTPPVVVPAVNPAPAASQLPVSDGGGPTVNRELIDASRPRPALAGVTLRGIDIDGQSLTPPEPDADTGLLMSRLAAGTDRTPRQSGGRGEAVRIPFEGLNVTADAELPAATSSATLWRAGETIPRMPSGQTPTTIAGVEAVSGINAGTPSQPASAAAATATSVPRIDIPVQDPAWGDVLNERVTFMAGKDIRSAEIRMNPAELGPIRIQLTVDERGTHVNFAAHHALTREAIEQALPRLRELFTDQGLSLGQASVSEQDVKQDREGFAGDSASPAMADAAAEEPAHSAIQDTPARSASGLVDTFA